MSEALVVTDLEVNVETGKAQLRDFEKAAERTAQSADASAKKIEQSFKKSTSSVFTPSERDAFLKPFADVQAEILGKVKGIGEAATAAEGETVAASAGISSGLGGITLAAAGAVAGIGVLAYGLNRLGEVADPITSLRRGFETLTERIGQNADAMLGKMQLATSGFISNVELMKAANEAILLQIPVTADKMGELAAIATQLGRAMGVEPVRALESITLGIGRESNRLLDNIGILVDTKKAHEDYAAALGKSAGDLTEAEKRTAFFNATLEAGRTRVKDLGGQSLTLAEESRILKNAIGDAKDTVLDFANVAIGRIISQLITSQPLVRDLALAFRLMHGPVADQIDDTKLLADANARLGTNFKATEEEGLRLSHGYELLYQNLGKLGISIAEQSGRIQTMKAAIIELREQMKVNDDGTFQALAKKQIKELEDGINKALGRSTGPVDDKDAARQAEKRLAFERDIQARLLQARIEGAEKGSIEEYNLQQQALDDQYALRIEAAKKLGADTTAVTALYLQQQDDLERKHNEKQGTESGFQIGETSPQLGSDIIGLGPALVETMGPIREVRELLLSLQDAANMAGKSFGDMAMEVQLSAVAMQAIESGSQVFANVLVKAALTGHGSAKELRKALGDSIAGIATEQLARAVVMAALGAAASTPWGAAALGPAPPYFHAAAAHAAAGGVALAAARVLGTNAGGSPGGGTGGGTGGSASAGKSSGVDYSGAIRTPAGEITGTTPVVVGDRKRKKTGNVFYDSYLDAQEDRAAASSSVRALPMARPLVTSAPVAPSAASSSAAAPTVINHYHQHTYTINAMDARSFRDFVNTPDQRRSLHEAVMTEQAGR